MRLLVMFSTIFLVFFNWCELSYAQSSTSLLDINLQNIDSSDNFVPVIKIIALLTVLSVAPAILLMMTSFSRILIVLSFIRQALGTQTMPPNQVIVGLAFFLTIFTMYPVWQVIEKQALTPYINKEIEQKEALENFIKPVKKFMLDQTRKSDLEMFYGISKITPPDKIEQASLIVLLPAFMISELKTAFQVGFLVYIPFLIIDMVISSVLMAMGMMMLPPTVVSLPFKLILFVLVDGWNLIVTSLVRSFSF